MKTFLKILIFSLLALSAIAQQASEIDPKFVKLPRYGNLTAITTAIGTPTQGMMVYNIGTSSNWYFNGVAWSTTSKIDLPFQGSQSSEDRLLALTNSGTGPAGNFEIFNTISNAIALSASTNGVGRAAYFFNNNAENTEPALSASTIGTGKAAYFQGTNALETNGTIKFGGSGVGTITAGKILTSDAVGNATWQDIPAVAAPLSLSSTVTTLTSTSTVGTAANFSSTSGYALITGTGNVGIGAAAPTAKLEVAGFTKLGSATAPAIKMVTFTGITANAQGVSLEILHGLSPSKIIAISTFVELTATNFIPNAYQHVAGYYYDYGIFNTTLFINNHPTNSGSILSKPIKVVVTYIE